MTERLLQFIWQFQYFDKKELAVSSGENLLVIIPGRFNQDQGPDFADAKIKIDQTTWAGTIELHLKTSDWQKHQHHTDVNYKNVILHVVWENDRPVNKLAVLELKDRVSKILLKRYKALMQAQGFIPCENSIKEVKSLVWSSWKERLLAERLLRKAHVAETYLQENEHHWEEVFWWMLARNFGIKVNADAFEAMARSIPVRLLAKYKHSIHQIEALLFGQAGLLQNNFADDYPNMLRREYLFLQKKHELKPVLFPVHFLRMRPGNFPTVRLAQLAALIIASAHLFSTVRETNELEKIKTLLTVTANDYWHYHYCFDEQTAFKKKTTGTSIVENIIINTIVPLLFAYGNYHQDENYKIKALQWLEALKPEKNTITKGFEALGIGNKNAYDSQALIELKNNYCHAKRCLECSVGNALLRS